MKYNKTIWVILIIFILSLIIFSISKQQKITDHYIINQTEISESSGHSMYKNVLAEINHGKIINGSYSYSYVGALGDTQHCRGGYLINNLNNSECWKVNCNNCLRELCNSTEEIKSCDSIKILSEEDINKNIEDLSQELIPYWKKIFQIYKAKNGCSDEICYKNGYLVYYKPNFQLSWERKYIGV